MKLTKQLFMHYDGPVNTGGYPRIPSVTGPAGTNSYVIVDRSNHKPALRVTKVPIAAGIVKITERFIPEYRIDTFHVYYNSHTRTFVARMFKLHDSSQEAVLVQFADKSKYFSKEPDAFENMFNKHIAVS